MSIKMIIVESDLHLRRQGARVEVKRRRDRFDFLDSRLSCGLLYNIEMKMMIMRIFSDLRLMITSFVNELTIFLRIWRATGGRPA